ncbi:hypothetical protein T484DRAFT_1775984 [Baffinella frigidus]|nr:hypothetical protein T484DRAFT_1775984 [Cryptophyta sp. CCMP2293]
MKSALWDVTRNTYTLGQALPAALTHLHLNGCTGVADVGVEAIALRCRHLADLSVVGVGVGDQAAAAVASLRFLQVLAVQMDASRRLTDLGRAHLCSVPAHVAISASPNCWARGGVLREAGSSLSAFA